MPSDRLQKATKGGRIGLWLFLWFLLFYCFFSSGHIFTPDGVLMYLVTEGLVERGDPAMPEEEDLWPLWHTAPGEDGRRYAIYGLGPSLLAMPGYVAGSAFSGIVPAETSVIFDRPLKLFHPRETPYFVKMCAVSLTNAAVAAGVVWLLFLTAGLLGFKERTSLALAFILGIASPLWHYAGTFFSEPMAAFALILFVFLLLRYRQSARRVDLLASGIALSAAILIKAANVVFLAAAVPLAVAFIREKHRRMEGMGIFLLGLISCAPAVLYYNAYRFGSIWETGYSSKIDFSHPFAQGFLGLLLSPGRGLFLYFPLAILSLLALSVLWKRERALSLFVLAMFLIPPALHAKWWSWEGGWCWGPRFFIPVLPLLMLPLGYWMDRSEGRRVVRWMLWSLAALSAVIAFSGVLVSFNDYYHLMKEQYRILRQPYYPDLRWDWMWSPLLKYWGFEHRNALLVISAFSTRAGWPFQIGFAAVGVMLAGVSAALWREVRKPRP